MSVQHPINQTLLITAIQELENYNVDNNKYKVELCKNILLRINNSPDMWQSLCPFNYSEEDTMSSFVSDLRRPIIDNQFNDRLLFISLFFLREAIIVDKIKGITYIRDDVKENLSSKEEIWNCFIKNYEELPIECREYIEFIENELEVPVKMISNGPKREDIIYKNSNI